LLLAATIALSAAAPTAAQTLPTLSADLVQWTETTVANLPDEDSNGFTVPTANDLTLFRAAVTELLAESWPAAHTAAAAVGYQVVAFTDTGHGDELLYALTPVAGNTAGRGYFFVRPQTQVERNLVLESPHPRNDHRSAVLTSEVFRASGARAFVFAGTHRCANTGQFSGCSGTTGACAGTTQGYLESDMAHTPQAFFQAFHELAAEETADTLTFQLHGFSSDATDPEFTVSDGRTADQADPAYLPNAFAAALEAGIAAAVAPAAPAKPGNSCNRAGDLDLLCGTNNTQGRFTNGSADVCTTSATTADGRFIHAELSWDLRHPGDLLEPQIVTDAVMAVVPVRGPQGRIGDRVWVDLDGDGLQDAGEPGAEAVSVELLQSGAVLAAAVTDDAGAYLFDRLAAGTYQVRLTVPAGYQASPAGAGTDAGADSDILPASGETAPLTLADDQIRLDVDAGLVPLGTAGVIGDRVWHDQDGDGLQQAGEPGLGGVAVSLATAGGTPVAATTTAPDGSYAFTALLPGSYVLSFDAPGWGATGQVAGFPDLDSDIDPATRTTGTVDLGADEVNLSVDAGFVADCHGVALAAWGSMWITPGAGGTWTAAWADPGFDDSGWTAGQSQLGFPADRVNTAVADTGAWTYYFRHSFEVTEPARFQDLVLSLYRDDAAVVYFNGVEVLRSNLPDGPIDSGTRALASSRETVTAAVPAGLLAAGTNVLAVEVHQRIVTSSTSTIDLAFDLELAATVCDPCRVRRVELAPVRMTQIREDSPTSNYDSRTTVWIDGDAGAVRNGLLGWDVSAIPPGAEVLDAEIAVEVVNDTSDFFPLYALARPWVEAEATWQQASDAEAWAVAGAAGATDRDPAPLGVASLANLGPGVIPLNTAGKRQVESWADGTAANHGLIVTRAGQTNGLEIDSDHGSVPPLLRVVYSLPSCTP
jgi:hypothetical protein